MREAVQEVRQEAVPELKQKTIKELMQENAKCKSVTYAEGNAGGHVRNVRMQEDIEENIQEIMQGPHRKPFRGSNVQEARVMQEFMHVM